MRETETFEYIRQKYPDKEEKWRKVTQLVKFDENLEVKSVHDFNINCYISTFGRLIRNGILCNMAYGDKYDMLKTEYAELPVVVEEVNAFHGYISVRSTSEEDKFRYFKVRRDIEWFYDKLFPKE